MKTQDMLLLGIAAGIGYLLYKGFDFGKKATDAVATSIADLWLKMFPLPPSIELLGNVTFPGNLNVPLQTLAQQNAVRQDKSTGDVYVTYAGYFWKLSPQVWGNWPATRVE